MICAVSLVASGSGNPNQKNFSLAGVGGYSQMPLGRPVTSQGAQVDSRNLPSNKFGAPISIVLVCETKRMVSYAIRMLRRVPPFRVFLSRVESWKDIFVDDKLWIALLV